MSHEIINLSPRRCHRFLGRQSWRRRGQRACGVKSLMADEQTSLLTYVILICATLSDVILVADLLRLVYDQSEVTRETNNLSTVGSHFTNPSRICI
jgi:hypothetical protein